MAEAPIFQGIFGIPWVDMPPVMQKHYAVRAYSADRARAVGVMNIRRSRLIRLLSLFLKIFGALVPLDGDDIPTTVDFYSGPQEKAFHFDRSFDRPGQKPFRFHSRLEQVAGHDVVEYMRFNVGWRSTYYMHGNRVEMTHIGYVWRLGKFLVPLPFTLLLGKGAAWEEVIDAESFRMCMTVTHPLFGEAYRYEGVFKMAG
jgi:hypothetical protein